MPYGTSLEDADKIISGIEDYIVNNIPEMTVCSVEIGSSNIFSTNDANQASVTVNLVDRSERKRSTTEVVNQIVNDLQNIVGAKIITKCHP